MNQTSEMGSAETPSKALAAANMIELRAADHAFVVQPFVICLAWISVALISNTFQFVTYLGWSGFGIPGAEWSVVMMTVGTGLGVFMLTHRCAWVFPLVVAWALVGAAQRHGDVSSIATTAYAR